MVATPVEGSTVLANLIISKRNTMLADVANLTVENKILSNKP